jgi:H+/Cl- antiporter ClcA
MSETDPTKTSMPKISSSGNGIGVGIAIGVAIGAAVGASSGNMAPSLAMGLALGTAIGAIFDFRKHGRSKADASRMQT